VNLADAASLLKYAVDGSPMASRQKVMAHAYAE